MTSVCIIGAGDHSRGNHLPALARVKAEAPDAIRLTGVADRDAGRASDAAKRFGFESAFDDVDAMLDRCRPDACMVVTSVEANAPVALRVVERGIPVLIEKPLAAGIAEARGLVKAVLEANARVMVSMNRRFDPQVRAALKWINGREMVHVRATMARHARREPQFLEHTGLHLVDLVRSAAGEIGSFTAKRRIVDDATWFHVSGVFASGATVEIGIMPTTGGNVERVEFFGADFRVETNAAWFDGGGWRAWRKDILVREERASSDTPLFVGNGTYDETVAFLAAVRDGSPMSPAPGDVLASMELCNAIVVAGASPQ